MNGAPLASANSLPRALLPVLPIWSWPIIGGVSALGFAPQSWWPLTVIAFSLLIEQSARGTAKRMFWIGWLFGLGHFTIGLRWIAVAFTYQAAMPEWLGYLGVVLIAVYLAVYPALTAMAARWLSGGRMGLAHVLAFTGFWILTEWMRGWVFTGFPWNSLSVIAVDVAGAAKQVGTYGLSGLLLIGIGGLALLGHRQWKGSAAALAFGGLTLVWHGFATVPDAITQKGLHLQPRIAIVQPNISQTDKYRPSYEATNFKKLAENTFDVIPPPKSNVPPRLIFWPEAAIPWSLESGMPPWIYARQPGGSAVATRAQLAHLMQPGDVLITGADRFVLDKKGDITGARNSVFAVNSDASLAPWRYDKAHLVPYGEYLPMKSILKPLGIDRLVPGSIDFLPGPGPRTVPLDFEGEPLKMGVQICYEIIFSGEIVDRANRPDFIFNPSNDAWFGTVGPPQHLAQARLRAVEEGLPIIRATPTGISALINPDGSLAKTLPHGVAGRIDAHLPRAGPPTFFGRYGNIIPLCLAGIFLLISYVANRRATR
jgi:apolipoprotein N-acyltransferase